MVCVIGEVTRATTKVGRDVVGVEFVHADNVHADGWHQKNVGEAEPNWSFNARDVGVQVESALLMKGHLVGVAQSHGLRPAVLNVREEAGVRCHVVAGAAVHDELDLIGSSGSRVGNSHHRLRRITQSEVITVTDDCESRGRLVGSASLGTAVVAVIVGVLLLRVVVVVVVLRLVVVVAPGTVAVAATVAVDVAVGVPVIVVVVDNTRVRLERNSALSRG